MESVFWDRIQMSHQLNPDLNRSIAAIESIAPVKTRRPRNRLP